MISKRTPASLFLLASAFVLAPGLAFSQTSIALSGYGAFSGTATGNGTEQSPANQAGGLVQLRHTSNPILGLEATYSFNRADQNYSSSGAYTNVCASGSACPGPTPPVHVPANAHEITADWIPSVHIASVRPFGILGAGVLLNIPSGTAYEASTACSASGCVTTSVPVTATNSLKAVYVYGAGLDWGLLPHLGLRLQYRGNLYQAPDLTKLYSSTNAFTHTAEPMIGIYFSL